MTGTSMRGSKESNTLSMSAFWAVFGLDSACSTDPSPENPRDFSGLKTNAQACAGQVRHPHAGHGRVTGAHGLTVRVQG